ncbi:MAG: prephenate dehydrogenase [Oscillospiraceae bacterium]|jgi:prephenate dehydrogenase|nr:prephenate dehydrogenase [Oscillospiraceae bacterium]
MNVAIAGLGLIGGSFAKAIKAKTRHRVTGYDNSPEVIEKAQLAGVIDGAGLDGFQTAGLVLVALYPGASLDFLRENAALFRDGAIIVDLCGVKRAVCGGAEELFKGSGVTFIGGHPMAGRELTGFDGSIPEMFENASMILTPNGDTPPDKLKTAEDFFLSLGFRGITRTTPPRHDEMIAFTSQLAHIVSSAYAQNPIVRGFGGFTAGSFGDMTRVAKLNEEMWTELFLLNGDYLTEQITVLTDNLSAFRKYIAEGDAARLRELLRQGRLIKESLSE